MRLWRSQSRFSPHHFLIRRDQRAVYFAPRAARRPVALRRRPFHYANPRARHERQLHWPQQRRASVCGAAAGVALRLRFTTRFSPPPLHFSRSPSADRSLVKLNKTDYDHLVPFDRDKMRQAATKLAKEGVFIGTSSWKYEGWFGQLYTPARYEFRGKVAKTRFERDCLSEYAEVFKTVSVDAAYYTFPSSAYLQKLADAVPDDFRFGFKVTDAVTIKKFPKLARFGAKAGQTNPDYLNAELFATAFLKACEEIRSKVGVFMFEFSRFWPSDYEHGRDFVADLDKFLGKLPKGWPYAIETRNKHWLAPEYFGCLARHGVSHIFNSWDAMPPVSEQMALLSSHTNPKLIAARFLLKPGSKYDEAVKTFQPYDKVKELNPEARVAGKALIAQGKKAGPGRETFIYVNNRLEGNALETIDAMLEEVG